MTEPTQVVDLLMWRRDKRKVEEIPADVTELSPAQKDEALALLVEMTQKQSAIISQMMADITVVNDRYIKMQEQFLTVSGQAYTCLQVFKRKNLITDEELEALWDEVKSKFIEPMLSQRT
jgi:hypothetical protein